MNLTNPRRRPLVAAALLALGLLASARPAPAGLQETDYVPMGAVDASALVGSLAITGDGAGVSFFDVTDPTAPAWLSTVTLSGVVGEIVVDGTTAFATTWTGYVESIDFSDPASPQVLDAVYVDFLLGDVAVVGTWLVGGAPLGSEIWRIDISNPSNLFVWDRISGVNAQGIVPIDDTSAWVGAGNALYPLDLNPFALGSPTFIPALRAYPFGNYLFIGASVYDASTLALIATTPLANGVLTSVVDGNTAYALDWNYTLHKISLVDPLNPAVVDSEPLELVGGTGSSLTAAGDRVLVSAGGTDLVDFSVPRLQRPGRHRRLRSSRDMGRVASWGFNVVASTAFDGAAVLQLSGAGKAKQLKGKGLPQKIVDVLFSKRRPRRGTLRAGASIIPTPSGEAFPNGDTVYLAAGSDGLVVAEHDGRLELAEVGRVPVGPDVRGLHQEGNTLFVVDGVTGVHILDVTDDRNPVEIGSYATVNAYSCTVSGTVMYVGNFAATNPIVDISDPTNPVEIGTFNGTDLLAVEGDRLYAAESFALRTYDISNPAAPMQIGLDTSTFLFAESIRPVPASETPGQRLVWGALGFGGIALMDVTDPDNPFAVESFVTRDLAQDVFETADGLVCVSDGLAGISILRRTASRVRGGSATDATTGEPAPAAMDLRLSAGPNPVRDGTDIRFQLDRSAPVTLEVFEVTGRRVATLLDGVLGAGPHSVRWDARDRAGAPVAAGAYFYRLRTPGAETTRKLLVVR